MVRLYSALERPLLGLGMTVLAFVIERRLVKALKSGRVTPAPRTAEESQLLEELSEAGGPEVGLAPEPGGRLLPAPTDQVGDQPRG